MPRSPRHGRSGRSRSGPAADRSGIRGPIGSFWAWGSRARRGTGSIGWCQFWRVPRHSDHGYRRRLLTAPISRSAKFETSWTRSSVGWMPERRARDEPDSGFFHRRLCAGGHCGKRIRGHVLADAGRDSGETRLRSGRPERPRFPRHVSRHRALSARPLPDHVCHAALDRAAVCRVLHRGGFQRLLPPQPRGRAEGPLGRVRSRHPSGLRLGPPARFRRRRHGGRRDQLDLRHAHAVLRHPARSDERVDDHERRGVAGARALYRGGGGTRCRAGEAVGARSRTTS